MPFNCQPPRIAAAGAGRRPLLRAAERQFVHDSRAGSCAGCRAPPGARLRSNTLAAFQLNSVQSRVVGLVDGLRVGVRAFEQQAAREAPVERGLQRVVDAVRAAVPLPAWSSCARTSAKSGRPSSPEPGICDALMSRNAKPLTDADPTYPTDADEFGRELALDDEVPRLDVAAVQHLVRHGIARLGHQRQRNPARADVGAADRRNADRRARAARSGHRPPRSRDRW